MFGISACHLSTLTLSARLLSNSYCRQQAHRWTAASTNAKSYVARALAGRYAFAFTFDRAFCKVDSFAAPAAVVRPVELI